MYHYTNLGSYAGNVRPYADMDGYVPENGDDHADMRWDSMTEWDDDSWAEHVAAAEDATKSAEAGIGEWAYPVSVRTKAQRAAEARYDAKRRGVTITLRLSREQAAWLDARSKPDESRPAAMRRLAKMPDMPPNC